MRSNGGRSYSADFKTTAWNFLVSILEFSCAKNGVKQSFLLRLNAEVLPCFQFLRNRDERAGQPCKANVSPQSRH